MLDSSYLEELNNWLKSSSDEINTQLKATNTIDEIKLIKRNYTANGATKMGK